MQTFLFLYYKELLALIKELTKEAVRWKEIAEGYQKQFEDCAEDRAKLTEENERLRAENVDCRLGFKLLEDAFKKLEKINEQCEEEKALLEKQFEEVHDIIESNIRAEIADNGSSCKWCENKVKADTVRKMQERLKAEKIHHKFLDDMICCSDIDQIAKEMLEDNNDI